MKITFLPPQPAPKHNTAHRTPASLGEHRLAFLNSNNPRGFMFEDIPEEPIAEHMAALFMIILAYMEEDDKPVVMRQPKRAVTPVVKKTVEKPIHTTPLPVIDTALAKPLGIRKHIVATRQNYSIFAVPDNFLFTAEPLRDVEYVARRKALLASDPDIVDLLETNGKRLTPLQEYELYRSTKNPPMFNVANPDEVLYRVEGDKILTKEGSFYLRKVR